MPHLFALTVRSTDLDSIGHVNNAKYLEYMEWARFDWICRKGFTLDELKRLGVAPVVVNITINYRKELRMLEEVQIKTSLIKVGTKSFVLRHEVFNQREELVADADVTMVMIDAKLRKSIPLPTEIVQAMNDEM